MSIILGGLTIFVNRNSIAPMAQALFEGMGVALVTPFKPDKTIDYPSLAQLLEHIALGGADFVVVHGTTGESPCLTRQERDAVTDFVVDRVAGRMPIMIGLGGNDTLEVGERMRQMQTAGISGILSVVPYYNKPTQEGLYQHFSHLAQCAPLPIVLYNVPGRAGVNMMPETVARLAEQCPNIIGVKEASGFVAQAEQTRQLVTRQDFTILSGDDNISIDFIRNGARGVISVVGNAYPKLFTQLIHLSMQGRYHEAEQLMSLLRETNTQLFANGNPSGIKALLHHMGIITYNELRLPLVPASEQVYQALARAHQAITKGGKAE